MRLGALIRKYRTIRGLDQMDLATLLRARDSRLDQSAVSKIERSKKAITLEESVLFIDVLGIPKDEMQLALSAELDAAIADARPPRPVKKRTQGVTRFRSRASGDR